MGCFRNGVDGRQCRGYGLLFQHPVDFCYNGSFPVVRKVSILGLI